MFQLRPLIRMRLPVILAAFVVFQSAALAAKWHSAQSLTQWRDRVEQAEDQGRERWAAVIWDLDSGKEVFAWRADKRLAPASNRKIVTLGMALEILGPDYVFTTEFGLDSPREANKAHYHGNLILRSMGDPALDGRFMKKQEGPGDPEAMLKDWLAKLRSMGIAYIHGDLIIDASAFGPEQRGYPSVWKERYRGHSYATIPTSVAIEKNLLTVTVKPGVNSGAQGNLEISPYSGSLKCVNRTVTRTSGASGVAIDLDKDTGRYIVSGKVRRGRQPEIALAALDDPLASLADFLELGLERNGIALTGKVRIQTEVPSKGPQPIVELIGEHRSVGIGTLLTTMVRNSDNFLAEQIWRACAARIVGAGTTENARRIEQDWYRAIGQGWMEPGWDGSGLSRQNATTPRELTLVLDYLYRSAHREFVMHSMAVSGKRGTLRERSFKARAGRVFGKTGTLSGVSALSGFILDKDNQPRLIFSVIGNANVETYGRLTRRIDDLMILLIKRLDSGAWPRTQPASEAVAADSDGARGQENLKPGSSDDDEEKGDSDGESLAGAASRPPAAGPRAPHKTPAGAHKRRL